MDSLSVDRHAVLEVARNAAVEVGYSRNIVFIVKIEVNLGTLVERLAFAADCVFLVAEEAYRGVAVSLDDARVALLVDGNVAVEVGERDGIQSITVGNIVVTCYGDLFVVVNRETVDVARN